MKRLSLFVLIIFLCKLLAFAEWDISNNKRFSLDKFDLEGYSQVIYKETDSVNLKLYILYPSNFKREEKYPAVAFFFGGGWRKRNITQFLPHSYELSKLGVITILVDYRVESLHNVSPIECVRDARDAMRYLRKHHEELSINPNKIAAAGGSAGGHLAAATATIDTFDDHNGIDPTPNALILFNPVIDNGPNGGYAYAKVKKYYREFSPAHNIKKGLPPTLFMIGTNDKLIPLSTAIRYQHNMIESGNRCDLFLYANQEHSFFNYKDGNNPYYYNTLSAMITFLKELHFITYKSDF